MRYRSKIACILICLAAIGPTAIPIQAQIDCVSRIEEQGRVLFFVMRTAYAETSSASNIVAQLDGGTLFRRIDGPVCQGAVVWLPIEIGGQKGWIVEREGARQYVEPFLGIPHSSTPSTPQGQIAFTAVSEGEGRSDRQYRLYVVSVDGSKLNVLAENAIQSPQGYWSPDGTAILIQSYTTGPQTFGDYSAETHIQFLRVAPDGTAVGEPKRLVSGLKADFLPVWSSDGQHILFIGRSNPTLERYKDLAVYSIRPDGSDLRRMSTLAVYPFSSIGWSYDNRQIAFGSPQGDFAPLVRVDVNGQDRPSFYTVDGRTAYMQCGFAWSPTDDSMIANISLSDCVAGSKLYFAASGSSELQPLPDRVTGSYAWGPRWSPTGHRFAYSREMPATPPQVFSYDPQNDDLAQLTVTPDLIEPDFNYSLVTDPTWSPDGKWLAVVWYRTHAIKAQADRSSIYLVDAGSNVMWPVLENNPAAPTISGLAWRPVGAEK